LISVSPVASIIMMPMRASCSSLLEPKFMINLKAYRICWEIRPKADHRTTVLFRLV
jgi:hypothetical protein